VYDRRSLGVRSTRVGIVESGAEGSADEERSVAHPPATSIQHITRSQPKPHREPVADPRSTGDREHRRGSRGAVTCRESIDSAWLVSRQATKEEELGAIGSTAPDEVQATSYAWLPVRVEEENTRNQRFQPQNRHLQNWHVQI